MDSRWRSCSASSRPAGTPTVPWCITAPCRSWPSSRKSLRQIRSMPAGIHSAGLDTTPAADPAMMAAVARRGIWDLTLATSALLPHVAQLASHEADRAAAQAGTMLAAGLSDCHQGREGVPQPHCLSESGVLLTLDPGSWIGNTGYVGNDMITPIRQDDSNITKGSHVDTMSKRSGHADGCAATDLAGRPARAPAPRPQLAATGH